MNIKHTLDIVRQKVHSGTAKNSSMKLSENQVLTAESSNSYDFYKNLSSNFYHMDYTNMSPNKDLLVLPKGKSSDHLENIQDDYVSFFDTKITSTLDNELSIVSMETIPMSTISRANDTVNQEPGHLKKFIESKSLESGSFEFNLKKSNTSFSQFCENKSIIACQSPEILSMYQECSESNLSSTDSSNISNNESFLSFKDRYNTSKNMEYSGYKPKERYFQNDNLYKNKRKLSFATTP